METDSEKFQIIHNIMNTPGNVLRIDELCKTAGVSRSGYYNWINSKETRQAKELQDQNDFDLILEAFKYRGYDKGIRGIHMRLLHIAPPVHMNVKKIQRLIRKMVFYVQSRRQIPTDEWSNR